MKFLLKVGEQLDLNVAYNGGAADSGLLYTAPENNGVASVVSATGVVTALAKGDTVINVFHGTPSVLVATIMIEVANVAEYAERLAIRQGDNAVVIGSAAVPQAVTYTAVPVAVVIGSAPYAGRNATLAFDGLDGNEAGATFFESSETGSGVSASFIGQIFGSPKQIKKIRIMLTTAPRYIDVKTSDDGVNWTLVTTLTPEIPYDAANSAYKWQEFILPTYAAKTRFILQPQTGEAIPGDYWATHMDFGGSIDRFRVWDVELFE